MGLQKRGLSPIIATALLVLLAVILGVVIFLWARSVIAEKVEKDIGGGPVQMSEACQKVSFRADVISGTPNKIDIENIGNIPIYGIEIIKVEDSGTKKIIGKKTYTGLEAIRAGQSHTFEGVVFSKGDKLTLIPILIGTTNNNKKEFICDESYGIQTTVL